MKYGSGTKKPKKEDDTTKMTVVIDRCNDKKNHDTNGNIPSISGSKEEAMFDELEANQFDWHITEDLLESLSSHYSEGEYVTKNTTQKFDLC